MTHLPRPTNKRKLGLQNITDGQETKKDENFSFAKKTSPHRLRTASLCRVKQECSFFFRCSGCLIDFEFIMKQVESRVTSCVQSSLRKKGPVPDCNSLAYREEKIRIKEC